MGRNKKLRKYGNTTAEQMAEALNLVINDGLAIRQVSIATGIKYATLWRYVDKKKRAPENKEIQLAPNYNSRKVFTDEQEKLLVIYMRSCGNMAYGVESKSVRKLAYEFAARNHVKVPEAWVTSQIAGKDWMRAFLERQKILTQNAEEKTLFSSLNAEIFFNNLEEVLTAYPSLRDGYRIYNLGEITLATVSKKGGNTSTKKSSEKGQIVTICMIASAAGNFLPPTIIFPTATYTSDLVKSAPCRSLGLANPTGSMTDVEFLKLLNQFITFTGSSKENPTILVLENNKSSTSLKIVDRAKEAGVFLLSLPPNSNNLMHPLNISVHGPFKAYYKEVCKTWQKSNSKSMTIKDISPCIAEAFHKALTPLNILWGFKSSGIFPCNPQLLTVKSYEEERNKEEREDEESESDEESENLEAIKKAEDFEENC